MDDVWPTKYKDMQIAQSVMEEYAQNKQSDSIGLFELVVDEREKQMNFRLANWVLILAGRFNEMYGANQGNHITRLVISRCMVQGQTLH